MSFKLIKIRAIIGKHGRVPIPELIVTETCNKTWDEVSSVTGLSHKPDNDYYIFVSAVNVIYIVLKETS